MMKRIRKLLYFLFRSEPEYETMSHYILGIKRRGSDDVNAEKPGSLQQKIPSEMIPVKNPKSVKRAFKEYTDAMQRAGEVYYQHKPAYEMYHTLKYLLNSTCGVKDMGALQAAHTVLAYYREANEP